MITLLVVVIGVAVAFLLFGPRTEIPATAPDSHSPLTLIGRRDLYGDAINETFLMRPGQRMTSDLVALDTHGIDGAVNGTAAGIGRLSIRLRRVQNGFVRTYALTMVAGAAVVGLVLVLGQLG